MMDPSGEAIGLPLSLIENSWFTNYFVPGLILFMMLGVILIYDVRRYSRYYIRWLSQKNEIGDSRKTECINDFE